MNPKISPISFAVLLLLAGSAAVANPPRLDSVSAPAVTPGEFVLVQGEFFGAAGSGGVVEIGGVPAATARWTDTVIAVYASAGVQDGNTTIRVLTSEGASSPLPLEVRPYPAPVGRLEWRFKAEGPYGRHRPSVGADGTIYFGDVRGFVYAIGVDGRVRWIHHGSQVSGAAANADKAPVAIGPDGTLYVAVDPAGPDNQIHALAPDGSLLWIHHQQWAPTIAGPSVGPDGNIYVLYPGTVGGLTCLSSQGTVLWSRPGVPVFTEFAIHGAEIAFGPSTPNGPVDRLYLATDQSADGTFNPHEAFWGFDLDGTQVFNTETGTQSSAYAYDQGQPVVGPDGTVFLSASTMQSIRSVQAYDPDGTLRWFWKHPIADAPTVPAIGPDGTVYAVSGSAYLTALDPDGSPVWEVALQVADDQMMWGRPALHPTGTALITAAWRLGQPDLGVMAVASFRASDGSPRWREEIPLENGFRFMPLAEAAFSPSGDHAYLAATQPGLPTGEETWSLFAFAEDECPADPSGCAPMPDAGVDPELPDAGDAGSDPVVPDAGTGTNDPSPSDGGLPGQDAGSDPSGVPGPVGDEQVGTGCSSTGVGAIAGLLVVIAAVTRRRRAR